MKAVCTKRIALLSIGVALGINMSTVTAQEKREISGGEVRALIGADGAAVDGSTYQTYQQCLADALSSKDINAAVKARELCEAGAVKKSFVLRPGTESVVDERSLNWQSQRLKRLQ